MLRGYRGILAALVGLVLVGASQPPKADQQTDNTAAKSEIAKAAQTIASALRKYQEPAVENSPCQPGQDNRKSDLCAQWKAADATREAAQYAYWGLLLGFTGTVMLVLTFWETRRTTRAQLRAYVSATIDTLHLEGPTGKATADLKITNHGQTPAFKAHWGGNIVVSTSEAVEADLKRKRPKVGRPIYCAINGGQTVKGSIFNQIPFTREQQTATIDGTAKIFIWGTVWYRDAFRWWRDTRFCYEASIPAPSKNTSGVASDGMIEAQVRFRRTPFHNDAA